MAQLPEVSAAACSGAGSAKATERRGAALCLGRHGCQTLPQQVHTFRPWFAHLLDTQSLAVHPQHPQLAIIGCSLSTKMEGDAADLRRAKQPFHITVRPSHPLPCIISRLPLRYSNREGPVSGRSMGER